LNWALDPIRIRRMDVQTTTTFIRRCLLALAFAGLWSGCTSARRGVQRLASSHLADTATSYNLAIEQTQDEMLLLNIIRAQDNYPLYITDASKVTGTVKADLSLGFKIPLLHTGSSNDYSGMPSFEYFSSPAMDVNLLNSQDFMAGFLTPIPTKLFFYYWDQGWTAEFLLYLLVLRVDEYQVSVEADKHPKIIRNQPDADDASLRHLTGFAAWVQKLVSGGRPKICIEDAEAATIGPPLRIDDLEALRMLTSAKEGLSLSPVGAAGGAPGATAGKWQLKQTRTIAPSLARRGVDCPNHLKRMEGDDTTPPIDEKGASKPETFMRTHVYVTPDNGVVDVLTLRSPEGILYYLGELAGLENRAATKRALLIHVCDSDTACGEQAGEELPLAPLFVALDKKQHGQCEPLIWVRALDQSDYLIPKKMGKVTRLAGPKEPLQLAEVSDLCVVGQTMHALELLSQLIGLQKSTKDISTTSTVKVLGQ
jgi:hypothetical protein